MSMEKNNSDYFPYEEDLTDTVFVVEGKKLHVSKTVLICASPVFKTMFTSDFREKNAKEIEFPEKNIEAFVLFLRCIYPGKYVKMNEEVIEKILPLAREYDTETLLLECQDWMLNDIELKIAKECFSFLRDRNRYPAGQMSPREEDATFLMKWLSYASEYNLEMLFKRCLTLIVPYQTTRIKDTKYYDALSSEVKHKLLETRMNVLEKEQKIDTYFML